MTDTNIQVGSKYISPYGEIVTVIYISPFQEIVLTFEDGSTITEDDVETFEDKYVPVAKAYGWATVVQVLGDTPFFLDEIHVTRDNALRAFERGDHELNDCELLDVIYIEWNGGVNND